MKFSLLLCLALSLPAVTIDRAAPEARRPRIVVADHAGVVERFAAHELARYVERISGVRLEIAAESKAPGGRPQIHVGATRVASSRAPEAAGLAEDGFVLRDLGNAFVIAGHNPRGTLYGVYALLEDHLGCRWVEPGPQGEFVPALAMIDLAGIRDTQAPDLPHRCLRIRYWNPPGKTAAEEDYIDWQAKQRMNYLYWIGGEDADAIEARKTNLAPFHANNGALLDFVRKRGFIIDHSGHSFHRFSAGKPIDFVSTKSEDEAVALINQYLDENPFLNLLGLWPSDGWGGFTVTAPGHFPLDGPDRLITRSVDFRADEPKKAFTNSYVDFVGRVERRVRERHPNVHLTMIAYNRSLLPPDKVRCGPGQQVHIAFRRSNSYGFGDPRSAWNRAQVPLLQDWMKACGHVVIYDYYQTGNLGSLGRPMPRSIAEDLKYLKRVGAAGTASQSDPQLFRALGPNYYTYAKFSWNTNADLAKVLGDYYRHTYGPAAAAAQKVFDLWESVYNEGGDYFRYDWSIIVPLFKPAVRAGLAAQAREAERLASGAPEAVRTRAGELRLVIEFFDAFIDFAQTGNKAARSKMNELAQGRPFLRFTDKAFTNAAKMHREGK